MFHANEEIFNEAAAYIDKYNETLAPVFTTIKKFISSKKLIYTLDDAFVIYSETAEQSSRALTLEIMDVLKELKLSVNWLVMRCAIYKEEYGIYYDQRPLATIFNVEKYKGVNLFEIMVPDDNYLPAEIELMSVYHRLYDPSLTEMWEYDLQKEGQLFDSLISRVDEGKVAGGQSGACKASLFAEMNALKIVILTWVNGLHDDGIDAILIGEMAIKLISLGLHGIKITDVHDKIQLIGPLEPLEQSLTAYISSVSPFKLSKRTQSLHLFDDRRTTRTTFYVVSPCSDGLFEKPFLDVFNSTEFELIPWVSSARFLEKKNENFPKSIKIGNLWVLSRFLLIDLWVLRIIKRLKLIEATIYDRKLSETMVSLKKIRNPNFNLITRAFNLNYSGIFISEKAHKKELMAAHMNQDFVPAFEVTTHGDRH